MKTKAAKLNADPITILAAGQIWKAGESYVHIQQAGPNLIHYKMAKSLDRPGLRRHLASVKTVQAFLTSQHAELLPAKAASPRSATP